MSTCEFLLQELSMVLKLFVSQTFAHAYSSVQECDATEEDSSTIVGSITNIKFEV